MISTNDFFSGVTIEIDGQVYQVVESQHVKPGKGQAFVRTKLKHLKNGAVVSRTFRADEKVPRAHVEGREMQFLYEAGDQYFFMDTENFEQLPVNRDDLGDGTLFLKENTVIRIITHQGQVMGVELPAAVELVVTETAPGLRGDTASGGSKPATLETGAVLQVPLFINTGDTIKVNTRTGEYISRA